MFQILITLSNRNTRDKKKYISPSVVLIREMISGAPDEICSCLLAFLANRVKRAKATL